MYLEFLFIHPDHQGIGAGKKLLEWGMNIADEAGVRPTFHGHLLPVPIVQSIDLM
jgi:GNAT superfamily N-acetyltransferase